MPRPALICADHRRPAPMPGGGNLTSARDAIDDQAAVGTYCDYFELGWGLIRRRTDAEVDERGHPDASPALLGSPCQEASVGVKAALFLSTTRMT
eukprot:gene12450-biopygen12442